MQTRIGKYEIKKKLGKGASATVYLATDSFTGADVALKVIDPAALKDLQQGKLLRSQFFNETSLAGKLINPVLDYDWGPAFDPNDGAGVVSSVTPRIKQVIKMLVPKVDADGNEIGGVPVVLRDAPLGTYMGWNITAGGALPFHQEKLCMYAGGMIPFAKTKAERMAKNDPRLSLEERYVDHASYVAAVAKAAANAVAQKFLLPKDAAALVAAAEASSVLK
ncbi:MAG: alpha/beta hydrolase domain-containing protein [Burkholderiales bacterium]